MSLIISDRVVETTTTTGTGAITLAGAMTGYQGFSAKMSVGDTCYYCIEAIDSSGNPTGDWETGVGTYSATNTLTRTTVSDSSNAGAAVTFATGTKRVFMIVTGAELATLAGVGLKTYDACRLYITAGNNSSQVAISEIQVFKATGGNQVVLNGTVGFSTQSAPSNIAANVDDGSTGTGWFSQSGSPYPQYVSVPLNGQITPASVSIAPFHGFTGYAPKDFQIQFSLGGGAWETLASFTGQSTWTNDTYNSFTIPTPVNGPKLSGLIDVNTTTPAPTNGQVLQYNSASGLWVPATMSSGMTLIQSISPGGTAAASFTSIPQTYKSLRLVGFGRSAGAGTAAIGGQVRFNSDTGAHYNLTRTIASAGSTPGESQALNQTSLLGYEMPLAGCYASVAGSFEMNLPNYSDTTFYKSVLHKWVNPANGTAQSSMFLLDACGYWASTAAITQIDLAMTDGSNWAVGSRIDLYGLN